ncbi:MAG: serine/threonine protein kinase [Cyanobacteria bacterium SZAS-4]|nr:serine/threonine protein kinase [Cyanobacteria bacterium SZAS-4]
MKKERVVISTHNSTMRTALRLVALFAPLWAVYIPGLFLGIFGFFLVPVYFDVNDRIYWLLASFSIGAISTAALLVNSLILSKTDITFPPLKAMNLPVEQVKRISWHWDAYEHEVYLRFWVRDEHVDIHHSRLSPRKLTKLKDALRRWSPSCEIEVEPEDLEDLISLSERFYKPKKLVIRKAETNQAAVSIDIPYDPHEQFAKFKQSLGANEKYFWYCWVTMLLIPCVMKIPDVVWGFIADARHIERFVDVPPFVKAIDFFSDVLWRVGTGGFAVATGMCFDAAANPFVICILLGVTLLSLIALGMFICQPNGIRLKADCLQLFFRWQKIPLHSRSYEWKNMLAFQLDQFGDVANPEKWRMQIKMRDGSTVNLNIEAIKGNGSRETLLKTITKFAPEAVQDQALIRALMPPQRESYTELWLQTLTTPPKRNRLTPLSDGQRLKSGKYIVERQLASGGQGVAYLAHEGDGAGSSVSSDSGSTDAIPKVVLKEFVLPVYTSRTVRKQALERFENEARILEELSHPQIVKLIDFFLEDHRAYLVLEHIDGMSLRQLVAKNGPMPLADIISLSMQMCDVLEYLHSLSPAVVHRDFTPDNLILDSNGRLVLIDFNVAQQKQWTTTSTVVGKHAYLPAEQFRGKPTTQSDLYAMGATLYFLFSGKDPQPITSSHPREFDANVAKEFDDIVSKLTATESEERYYTAAEARSALCSVDRGNVISILQSETISLNNVESIKEKETFARKVKS